MYFPAYAISQTVVIATTEVNRFPGLLLGVECICHPFECIAKFFSLKWHLTECVSYFFNQAYKFGAVVMSCFRDVPWKLYCSRAIAAWGDRMWMFAVGLFMVCCTANPSYSFNPTFHLF